MGRCQDGSRLCSRAWLRPPVRGTSLSLALSLGAPTCWLALPETQQVPHPGTADTGPRRLWGRPVRCGGQAAPGPTPSMAGVPQCDSRRRARTSHGPSMFT